MTADFPAATPALSLARDCTARTASKAGKTGVRRLPLALRDAQLLAWLALEGPTARTRLATLLWPDSDAEAARNSLRQRLFQLRKQLGMDVVVGSGTLALAVGVEHDLADSDSVLGETAADSSEFGHWLEQQRASRRGRMRQSLVELAEMAEDAKDLAGALTHASELLALEPLSEDAHRRVIRLHYLLGDRAAALLAFDRCERLLKDEVGAKPSAQTLALLATIEQSAAAISVPAGAAQTPRAVPASLSRPPRIVGRAAQWQALHDAWDASGCVLVTGEGGMGKSRLVGDFAQSRGATLMASARPGDERVAYASFSRLLRALPQAALMALDAPVRSELARLLPELGTSSALRDDRERTRFFNAVGAILDSPHLALEGIVFDDLHFADDASIELLQFVSAGSTRSWLVAARSAEVSVPGRKLLQDFMAQPATVQLSLGPLALQQVAELLDSLGIEALHGDEHAAALLRHTGGNPLYVLETVKAWLTQGSTTLPSRLPAAANIGSLIERRMACLSQAAVQLARCAAVAAPDFSIELASQVLGVRTLHLADPWRELETAHVLQSDGAFAHDLIYESALASVPAAVAQRLHAEIAEFLGTHDGHPARVAAHWLAAQQDLRALPWLQQAAEAARGALRHREFIHWLQTKARIEETDGRFEDAFESLYAATAEARSTGMEKGVVSCDHLDRLAHTPQQAVRGRLLRAWALAHEGQVLAEAIARQALSDALALGDTALVMQSHDILSSACTVSGQYAQAVQHGQACLAWYEAHGSAIERAECHGGLAMALDNLGQVVQALVHHQAACELHMLARDPQGASVAACNLGRNRIFAGRLPEADAAVAHAEQLLGAYEGEAAHLPQLRLMRAWTLCSLGRFDAGLAIAEETLQTLRQQGSAHEGLAAVRLASVWWQLGQWARLRQVLAAVPSAHLQNMAVRVGHARMGWAYARAMGGAGVEADSSDATRQVLQQVLQGIAPADRPDLRLPLMLDLADPAEPQQALSIIEQVQQEAQALGYANALLAAHVRAAEVASACDPPRARREALAALALQRQGVQTTALLHADVWRHTARALATAGDRAHAAEVAEEGRAWLLATAREHVPEAFQEGYLHANPANRDLLALASQLSR